jgi:hypothetical protein
LCKQFVKQTYRQVCSEYQSRRDWEQLKYKCVFSRERGRERERESKQTYDAQETIKIHYHFAHHLRRQSFFPRHILAFFAPQKKEQDLSPFALCF